MWVVLPLAAKAGTSQLKLAATLKHKFWQFHFRPVATTLRSSMQGGFEYATNERPCHNSPITSESSTCLALCSMPLASSRFLLEQRSALHPIFHFKCPARHRLKAMQSNAIRSNACPIHPEPFSLLSLAATECHVLSFPILRAPTACSSSLPLCQPCIPAPTFHFHCSSACFVCAFIARRYQEVDFSSHVESLVVELLDKQQKKKKNICTLVPNIMEVRLQHYNFQKKLALQLCKYSTQ